MADLLASAQVHEHPMKQPVFGSKRSAVRRLLAFVTTACCVLSSAYSQPGGYSSQDKRAIKLYESGSTCMQQRKWACARGEFTKAAEADARFVEPRLMLAEMAEQEGKDEEAITRYREVVSISPRFFPTAQLHLADLEFKGGRYAEAEQSYKAFLAMEQDPVRKSRAKLGLENCAFAARAILQPVPFEPKNMGPSINSADPEYYPCLTADDGTLIYTRRVKAPEIPVYGMQEDFYISRRGPDGQWQQSRTIPTVSDPGYNEGAGTLTPDGRFIIYTQCALEDGSYAGKARGLGGCDLFITETDLTTKVSTQYGPNTAVTVTPDPTNKIYEFQVRATYDVAPLMNFSGLPLLGGVPILGTAVPVEFTATASVEHPEGLNR